MASNAKSALFKRMDASSADKYGLRAMPSY